MADWEQMAREVLVAGRPDKVQSAALGWKELLKNVGQVQESLQQNVKDLSTVWKGPAYEAFKSHVEGLAKQAGGLVDAAEKPGRGRVSIVTNLETAAKQLQQAQDTMPIPAACVGDVLAARNGELVLGVGLFETRVKADLMGSWPMEKMGELGDWVSGWFSDQEGDARKVYNEVNGNYQDRVLESPSGGPSGSVSNPRPDIPNLGTGPGTGGGGGVPGIGGTPSTAVSAAARRRVPARCPAWARAARASGRARTRTSPPAGATPRPPAPVTPPPPGRRAPAATAPGWPVRAPRPPRASGPASARAVGCPAAPASVVAALGWAEVPAAPGSAGR